jgi:hypothetical protein
MLRIIELTGIVSLESAEQIFVMKKRCIVCKLGIKFWNVTYSNFAFEGLTVTKNFSSILWVWFCESSRKSIKTFNTIPFLLEIRLGAL